MKKLVMNKIRTKNVALKVLVFCLLRSIELTVLYFFSKFIYARFFGWHADAILAVSIFVYLFYVVSGYIDDYAEKHRYDDVEL